MSKNSKKTTKAQKSPAKKGGKKPTVAEAVAARKAEVAAAQAETAAPNTTMAPAEVATEAATKPKTKGKKAKTAKAPRDGKPRLRDDGTYSVLDAAHKVLKEAGTPLNAQTICERALGEGYWKSEGKTPQATIYAAIIREIAAKGDQSRFKKVDKGLFTATN